MLLLLLKDLWTGDLPLGGESSIGRGRLRGLEAKLCDQENVIAEFKGNGPQVQLVAGDRTALNDDVAALKAALTNKESANAAA